MAMNAAIAGSGSFVLRDSVGNSCPLGILQSASLDAKGEVRELIGANKMPVLVADVGRKITLTATFAEYSSALINLWMGGTVASGARFISSKLKTASASAFTVATADDGSPTGWAFVTDLGVKLASTGQPLKYNSGTLATKEYKNTAGAYTLHADEATAAVIVNYLWSQTAGERTTFSNSAIGLATYFAAYVMQQTTQADGTVRKVLWEFPAVCLPSLKIDFKNTDFMSEAIELSVLCDSSGVFAYQSAV
jgi:hypothetical protein